MKKDRVKPTAHFQDWPTRVNSTEANSRLPLHTVTTRAVQLPPISAILAYDSEQMSMSWCATYYCGALWLVAPADCSWLESLSNAHLHDWAPFKLIQANCSRRVQLSINILNRELYSRTGTPDGFTTGLWRLVGSSWPKSWQCGGLKVIPMSTCNRLIFAQDEETLSIHSVVTCELHIWQIHFCNYIF